MRNNDYIKFVLSKVEKNFAGYSGSPEYAKVITILHSLRSSADILREIYVLSGIKKLRELSHYLVFMFRKTESGRVNLDNFLENYLTDREFIENYLQTYYNLEPVSPEEYREEEREVFLFNEDIAGKTDETVYSLAEPSFKVEEIDNELVSEEFKETKLLEQYDISESKYLELIQNDSPGAASAADRITNDTEHGDDVFNLPTGTAAAIPVPEKQDSEDTVFDEPKLPEKENKPAGVVSAAERTVTEENTEEELLPESEEASTAARPEEKVTKEEPHDLASFFEEIETETKPPPAETKEEVNIPLFEEPVTEPPADAFENEESAASDAEENIQQEEPLIPAEEEQRNEIEPLSTGSREEEEPLPAVNDEVEQTLKEIEEETTAEINNADFIKYEKELYEKNRTINGLFDDLLLILDSPTPDYEMKNAICDEIVSISAHMKDSSVNLSLEIISKVYTSFVFCLDKKFREIAVSRENIDVFRNSLDGVEKLIKGEELSGFDRTIKLLDELENDLNDLLAKREAFEKKKFDFGEEERKIIEEFTDSGEREAYLALRERIMDTEEIFASITSEKERIAPFEVLRRLSSSFAQFREVVNIARILEMHKMAQLAEASYIFVKFLQNYRMDPYQKEVAEVLKYIVYCSKLIYLDKPVKDLDTFVSYLNDPVKIFHANTKDKNE